MLLQPHILAISKALLQTNIANNWYSYDVVVCLEMYKG